jgi:hypothetical protein
MGATSSVSNKIYKHIGCGCIYCFDCEIQLLYSCYDCIELLRSTKNLKSITDVLQFEIDNYSTEHLLNNYNWKNHINAIQYANKNNIILEEFIFNTNILHKF